MAAIRMNNPPAWLYGINLGTIQQPTISYKGNVYVILTNGFSDPSGAFSQVFIRKSTNGGLTWTDITPAGSPIITTLTAGGGNVGVPTYENALLIGNLIYILIQQGHSPGLYYFWRFNLDTEAWTSNTTAIFCSNITSLSQWITRCCYRASNNQIVCIHENVLGGAPPPFAAGISVFDVASGLWTVTESSIPATSGTNLWFATSMLEDSVGKLHVIFAFYPYNDSSKYSIAHLTIHTDNSFGTLATLVTGLFNTPSLSPLPDIGSLVNYLDVTPNQRKLAFTQVARTGAAATSSDSLTLWTAPESDNPAWTQTPVPIAEVAGTRLLNTIPAGSGGLSPVSAVLPVQTPTSTTLLIFWTTTNAFSGSGTYANYMSRLTYTNGSFSSVTTEYANTGTSAETFVFTLDLTTTNLNGTAIPTQTGVGVFTVNPAIPIGTTANGGILSFTVTLATGASVTNPSPTITFDAFDSFNTSNNLQFDVALNALQTNDASPFLVLINEIVSGTAPFIGYPFTVLLQLAPTTVGVPAVATVNPVEGTLASGTHTFEAGSTTGATAGGVFPALLSNTPTSYSWGAFFPTIDASTFAASTCVTDWFTAATVPIPGPSPAVAPASSGGGFFLPRSDNQFDDCLKGISRRVRLAAREICAKPKPYLGSYPWDPELPDMQPGYEPLRKVKTIVTPVPAAGDVAIVSFRVPDGYEGVILQGYNLYLGLGFEQGSGDIVWRIQQNQVYAQDWGNMQFSLGAFQNPFPFAQAIWLKTRQLVTLFVNVPNLSGAIQVGASSITGGLFGFFYPMES